MESREESAAALSFLAATSSLGPRFILAFGCGLWWWKLAAMDTPLRTGCLATASEVDAFLEAVAALALALMVAIS